MNSSRLEDDPICVSDSKIFFARKKCSSASAYASPLNELNYIVATLHPLISLHKVEIGVTLQRGALVAQLVAQIHQHLRPRARLLDTTQQMEVNAVVPRVVHDLLQLAGVHLIFVLILTELLRALQDYQMVIYGVLMLVAIVALPGGLYGGIRQLLDQLRSRADQRKEARVHAER